MTDFEILRDNFLNKNVPIQVFPATVKEVTGRACTVDLLATTMEVPGVRLVADPDAEEYVLITPKVGSTVLIGCIENDVANSYVSQFSEIESVKIVIGDTMVTVDGDRINLKKGKVSVDLDQGSVTLKQEAAEIALKGSKVSVKTSGVSLSDLFIDLTTLLNSLVVLTPNGPSSGLSPTSVTAITQLSTKVNQLLV